jgi:glycosyltransferase involved in cell wall biosynthesis
MIGEGPERRVVEERARERKISERVLFLGNHEFIEQFLPLADLFLLPSWHESFGLVALEAMSAGVPVIATNVGGTREVIEHGVDGYLVAPDDVPRMVEIGTSVLQDAAAAAAISENARKTALSRFSVDSIVDRYLELYREVLETPRPSSEKSRSPLASRRCE